jgi:hypothetical protein
MNTSLMTSVVHRFDRLLRHALESEREVGPGAIVLFENDLNLADDMLGGEFWTMGKIRESLRQLDEPDECVYRWLREAHEGESLALVVFSPGLSPGTMIMTFHTMTHHQPT